MGDGQLEVGKDGHDAELRMLPGTRQMLQTCGNRRIETQSHAAAGSGQEKRGRVGESGSLSLGTINPEDFFSFLSYMPPPLMNPL